MDLIEQHHLDRALRPITKTEEVTEARVAHPLVEHFGCCEENVGAFPLEPGAGQDYLVTVDH